MSIATTSAIPVIDIAPYFTGGEAAKRAVAGAIDLACRDIGFFTITGHGVPEALIASARRIAVAFFALPLEQKLAVERPPQKISRGYFRVGDRSLAYTLGVATPPDIQEAFAFGPEDVRGDILGTSEVTRIIYAPNLWPEAPAGFRGTLLGWYDAMSDLALRMMGVMARALDLPEDFFRDKFGHQTSAARLVRYPVLTEAPLDGQLRAGAHHDYGTLTFVRGDDTPGGLQVKHRRGGWIDVHPVPNSFVCNLGDMMMRWSNDRWISTLHRVAMPPLEAAPTDRISLVFFQMPDHDASIRCLDSCVAPGDAAKYPPITVSDYYLDKVMKAAHRRLDAGIQDAAAAVRERE